jgi:hypothetical protein
MWTYGGVVIKLRDFINLGRRYGEWAVLVRGKVTRVPNAHETGELQKQPENLMTNQRNFYLFSLCRICFHRGRKH